MYRSLYIVGFFWAGALWGQATTEQPTEPPASTSTPVPATDTAEEPVAPDNTETPPAEEAPPLGQVTSPGEGQKPPEKDMKRLAQGQEKDTSIKKKQKDIRDYYFTFTTGFNYFGMGDGYSQPFTPMQNLFNESFTSNQANFDAQFSFAGDPIDIGKNKLNLFGALGMGYIFKKSHMVELELGYAGFLPTNNADVSQEITFTENKACPTATIYECPFARNQFVDQTTGTSKYNLLYVVNEDLYYVLPALSYEYQLPIKAKKYIKIPGYLGVGTSVGLIFVSLKQQMQFSAVRSEFPAGTTELNRAFEGSVTASTVSSRGLLFKFFLSYRYRIKNNFQTRLRMGMSFGSVELKRDIDGSMVVLADNKILSTIPASDLGFQNSTVSSMTAMGFFIHGSILF